MTSQRYDGMLCGSGNMFDPNVYEVVDPHWWQVGRWLSWLFSKRRAKGKLTLGGRVVRMRSVLKP